MSSCVNKLPCERARFHSFRRACTSPFWAADQLAGRSVGAGGGEAGARQALAAARTACSCGCGLNSSAVAPLRCSRAAQLAMHGYMAARRPRTAARPAAGIAACWASWGRSTSRCPAIRSAVQHQSAGSKGWATQGGVRRLARAAADWRENKAAADRGARERAARMGFAMACTCASSRVRALHCAEMRSPLRARACDERVHSLPGIAADDAISSAAGKRCAIARCWCPDVPGSRCLSGA